MTSHDVALHAGVSQATVSRVLTGNTSVSEEMRDRVLHSLKELKYVPSSAARTMKTGRTGQIGVLMSAIGNPFHQELLQEISAELSTAELSLVAWYTDHGGEESARQAVRQGMVDGLILTAADSTSSALEAAIDGGLPLVLLHRMVEGVFCDQVGGDNWSGGRAVGQYVGASERKHRVGLVSGPLQLSTSRDREMGFRAGLKEKGIDVPPELAWRGPVAHNSGVEAVERFCSTDALPTAIFATSDLLAFGVIDGLRSRNVRVPEDVWVVGFDNTEMASWTVFDLTSVDQPHQEIVHVAVDMLREQLDGTERVPKTVLLDCNLVVRASTGGPRPKLTN